MIETRHCPECGANVEPEAVGGHCASCLLRIGLAVADGGFAHGLEEGVDPESPTPERLPVGVPARVRYVGDYELLEEVGRGGMGVVYRARQSSLNRLVALKLVRGGEFADEKEVARFHAEAEAVGHLDHPNIVPIYEVGEHEGRHYFSMKLVEGGTLSERISNLKWQISDREAAKLLATIARAVHYAHQRGILHRDLKPGNILLDAQGCPHVTDFGLAGRVETDSSLSLAGSILGTPAYMAPEQAAGTKTLTTAADVYSLGAVLYELLAGRPPFVSATLMETLQKVMNEEPAPPSDVRSSRRKKAHSDNSALRTPHSALDQSLTSAATSIDRDLEAICLKCLEKDPARRYGSAEALAEDLDRWLRREPILARPVTPLEKVRLWIRRKPALAAAVAALHLVAALGLAGILWQWRGAVAAREVAQQANDQRREQLWQFLGQQARFVRQTAGVGQRTNALAALRIAADIRPTVELRDEAIAALLLPDLGTRLSWKAGERFLFPWCFDSTLEFYLLHNDTGRAAIYRVSDHALVRELARADAITSWAQFSPDDRLVAVGFENGEVRVWNWRNGELVGQVANAYAKFQVASFDFTPDGRELLYARASAGVGRMNLADGALLPPLLTNLTTHLIRISPDGAQVALASRGVVEVWPLDSSKRIARADLNAFGVNHGIWSVAWPPNGGGLVLSVAGPGLFLMRFNQPQLQRFGDSANVAINRLFFNATGDLLFAGGWFNRFEIWDMPTLTPLLRESMKNGSASALSRDGRRLALVQEKVGLGVWEFFEPAGLRKFVPPLDVDSTVLDLDVHPTGRWVVTTHRDVWLLWDTTRARVIARGAVEGVSEIKFTPDGRAFHTGGADGLKRWPLSESPGAMLKPRSSRGNEAPINKDQSLLTSAATNFEMAVGPPEMLAPGLPALGALDPKRPLVSQILPLAKSAEGRINGASFSANRRYVAIKGLGYVVRVNLLTHGFAPPAKLKRADDNIHHLSADGRWLMTTRNNGPGPDLYDLETGQHVKRLEEAGIAGGIWQPHTGEFISQNTLGAKFWQPESWRLNRDFPWPEPGMGRGLLAIAPDGRVVWGNAPGAMRLYDLPTGRSFATLQHPGNLVGECLAFDPTGPCIYHSSVGGLIVWDFAELRRELARLGLDWRDENPSGDFAPRQP